MPANDGCLRRLRLLEQYDGLPVEANPTLVPASAHVLFEPVVLRFYVSARHVF